MLSKVMGRFREERESRGKEESRGRKELVGREG